MRKSRKAKYSHLNPQERALMMVGKLEEKLRHLRVKIESGKYGMGNKFDIEEFASDLDEIGEVEVEMEMIEE